MSKFPDHVKWHADNAHKTGEALKAADEALRQARDALNEAAASMTRARDAHDRAALDLIYVVRTAIEVGS